MPYQGDTTPATTIPAPSTPATTAAPTVTVIPAVDLFHGTVTITSNSGTAQFRHAEPRLIAQALVQAVRPTRWCEASKTLTVTVAAVGKREGVQRQFVFSSGGPA
ncbi:hypothetical protein [Paenarthrobacter aurescens]|uniref:hypothetical protein n=1 Tax=Paenarthrobacter aurescens TaxID=43663 RepID=UPI0021BEEC22|nr:hypothetical protein [Paenarthrobacter aurescens]MCT9868575.1 hypothetical protein [Paenarthrobacter aurescens]